MSAPVWFTIGRPQNYAGHAFRFFALLAGVFLGARAFSQSPHLSTGAAPAQLPAAINPEDGRVDVEQHGDQGLAAPVVGTASEPAQILAKDEEKEQRQDVAGTNSPTAEQQMKPKKLLEEGGGKWPVRQETPATPPNIPVPALPPAFGMGGFPDAPAKTDDPTSLQQFLKDNLTVTLRGGGTLRLYGFLRGDLDFATSRLGIDLQNPFFVLPDDSRFRAGPSAVPVEPNEFNYALYPRLSRVGMEYFGQPIDRLCGAQAGGRLEVDFLTPAVLGNSESRELLRLRLAYATVQCGEWTLLVGQDWDLVAPLIPTINDNTNMWNAGNLGDRRPQIKLLWDRRLGGGTVLQIQNGLILADAINNADLDGNGIRDHEDFGIPGYEGRIGLVLPSHVPGEKFLAGVWTMLAQDETDGTLPPPPIPAPGTVTPDLSQLETHQFNSAGVGADLRLPLLPGLTFQGEVWYGENLDDYRGGIAQGVNLPKLAPIHAAGGWGELVCRPRCWYQLAAGATVDHPLRSDVEGINQVLFPGFPEGTNMGAGRTLNWTWYLSQRFLLGNGLTVGLDYINWTTEYVGFHAGHASTVKFFLQQAF